MAMAIEDFIWYQQPKLVYQVIYVHKRIFISNSWQLTMEKVASFDNVRNLMMMKLYFLYTHTYKYLMKYVPGLTQFGRQRWNNYF